MDSERLTEVRSSLLDFLSDLHLERAEYWRSGNMWGAEEITPLVRATEELISECTGTLNMQRNYDEDSHK